MKRREGVIDAGRREGGREETDEEGGGEKSLRLRVSFGIIGLGVGVSRARRRDPLESTKDSIFVFSFKTKHERW